jgi:hypothetical protein
MAPIPRNVPKKKSVQKQSVLSKGEDLFCRMELATQIVSKKQQKIDNDNLKQLLMQKSRKIYEVEHVQKELEEMTDDEEEIKKQSPRKQEIWEIKKDIKVSFKRDSKPPLTKFEYYKFGRILGRGSFGKVNLALHKLTRKIVAVKSINKMKKKDESNFKKVRNEIEIMKRMRHKNVVKFFEELETDNHHLFFMEVC